MRCLLLVFVGAVIALPAGAQSLLVGMRAGQASSRQHWGVPGVNGKTDRLAANVTAGLSTTLDLKAWIALESDLLFVEKGMRESDGTEMRMSYVELPILVRLAAPIFRTGAHLFGEAGGAPSRETACELRGLLFPPVRIQAGASAINPAGCVLLRESRFDFGWVTGIGLLLRRPSYQVSLTWRLTDGVRDLEPNRHETRRFNDTRSFLIGLATRVR